MSIETNLNQSPYFDDFDENKNFHRVLFRPGFGVQARELTQLQSILQNQFERFGDAVVNDGKVVTGVGITTEPVNFVKLRDKDANNRVLLLGDFFDSGQVANATVTGESTGMTAQLIDVAEGSEAAAPNYLTAFVKYTNSGSNNQSKNFDPNEVLIFRNRNSNNFIVAANTIQTSPTGLGLRGSVSDGVIYHKGHFVRVNPQSIIIEKYNTTPNKKLGFETKEFLVNSNEDSSLLDNATGATNFSAPGADRLKLEPTLATRAITTDTANTTTFFTIANIENGLIIQRTNEELAGVTTLVADRIFETNGNFAIEPFNVRIREKLKRDDNLGRFENGDINKLVAEIEPSIAYVKGNRITIDETVVREFDKATDIDVKDARVIGQAIGNYVIVNELSGTWDFQGLREVDLYDGASNSVSGLNFSAQTPQGSKIGTAKVRGLQWHAGTSGTPSGQFRVYLFDIQMNSDKSFADVRTVHQDNGSGADGIADIVLTSGNAIIQESALKTLVFPFTQKGTKTLRDAENNIDTQFVVRTEKTVNFDATGTATVTPNTAHAGGTETLNDTGIPLTNNDERNIVVISKAPVETQPHTGSISQIDGTTVLGSGTTFLESYQVGDVMTIIDGATEYSEIVASITDNITLDLANNPGVSGGGNSFAHKTSFPKGYAFDLSSNGSVNSTSTQHIINLQQANLTNSFAASVYFDVLRSDASPASKVVNKNKFVHINTSTHPNGPFGPYSLGVSDAFELVKVYKGTPTGVSTSDPEVTNQFVLNSGMKDSFYDTSSIELKPDATTQLVDVGLLVEFNYFDKNTSSGIGFYSVDSYPIDDVSSANSTAIRTEEIPLFISPTTGNQYDLRDSVDFRPSKSNTVTPSDTGTVAAAPTNPTVSDTYFIDSDGAYTPTPDANFQTDIQFYLPRKDAITLTKEGNLEILRGVPSITPQAPSGGPNAMVLAVLDVPVFPSISPYVAKNINRFDYRVGLEIKNNRRFTMEDLRTIEQRIRNLEYYSSLNALETSARDKQIFGQSGLDRFKNGFLVDNFDGHNVADTTKAGYRAAIDRNKSVLRPTFDRNDISFSESTALSSVNTTQTGDLITLDYDHVTFIDQNFSSKLRNPVQELTFNWEGEVILNPSMDNGTDITTLPDIQLDFDNMYSAIEEIANRTGVTGTDWGNWTTTSQTSRVTAAWRTGVTTETQTNQIQNGIATSISPSTETFNLGNMVTNVAVRDYIRSRNVQITGFRLKPNTRVYPYFEDELVAEYVTPADSSFANTASEGSPLITDSAGTVYANFRIPNDDNLKFRIGTKRFTLFDVANTTTQSDLITTSAHGDYTAIQLSVSQRGSSINMKVPQFSDRAVSRTRTLTSTRTVRRDPISQTFFVSVDDSQGVFITKLDLFFGKKSSTLPVTVQLREVKSGFPSEEIVPYSSKTLQASEVNVDPNRGIEATTFTFDSPVFLENNKDYAIVVMPGGDSDEYALWTGELGGTDVNTGELIHKQLASGVLFTSANDRTYSPIQSEDLKYKLYRADFTTNIGTVYLENDDIDFLTYDSIDGRFDIGEKVVSDSGNGFRGFVTFIDYTNQKIHLERSTGGFETGDTITGQVSGASAILSSVDDISLNTFIPKIPQLTYANTSASWTTRTTSSSGVIGSQYVPVDLEVENDFFDTEKKVYSKTNESSLIAVDGSKKSLVLQGTFRTTDPRVSPAVDTSRTNGIIINNVINNDSSGEHLEIGNAVCRYITKPVELAVGNESEDIKVFVNAYKPAGTDVKVYARIHHPGDSEGINEKDFTPLDQITSFNVLSDSVDREDFVELEYGFSANTDGQGFLYEANSHARLNSSNSEVVAYKSGDGSIHHTYKTFALKIVMTSTGSNIVPLVKDMRAIALQK
jgi:hypothetical protein